MAKDWIQGRLDTVTTNMKDVLIFLENDMYGRNFISSGAMDGLMSNGAGVVLSEHVDKFRDISNVVGGYYRNAHNIKNVYRHNKWSMKALRHKCTTFDLKTSGGWWGEYEPQELDFIANYGYKGICDITKQSWVPNQSVEDVIAQHRPSVCVFPFTGVESTGYELQMLGEKYGHKTLFLINGWDNLGSKGMFAVHPDFVGVFGPQQMVDAVTVQGVEDSRVILMGCSRYEMYFRNPRPKPIPELPEKYVAFVGSTAPCDEIGICLELDRILDERHDGTKAVYRPHPWRQKRECFDVFKPEDYNHVVLDPQAKPEWGAKGVSSTDYPDLEYLPGFVANASAIVHPLTSFMIEAPIYGVPCINMAHDDGVHALPPSKIINYRQFSGHDNVPGWFTVNHMDELGSVMADALSFDSPQHLREAVRHYLYWDEGSYSDRLGRAVGRIRG